MKDVLIVAEGDSWFNYFYKDIPSHLQWMDNRYHVLHKAWPGDDFIKYIQRRDYLDTLKSWSINGVIKHHFLILSGGGNDMMKDHFDEYLDPNGVNFLSTTYPKKMKQLMVTYDLVFQLLLTQLPKVKVIVHGYDYPIPRKKGPWLGDKMTEKGIDHIAHGPTIMKKILDDFNNQLSALAAQYSNVEYIDLRGTTGGDKKNWSNEIHPTKGMFRIMANEFHNIIQKEILQRA